MEHRSSDSGEFLSTPLPLAPTPRGASSTGFAESRESEEPTTGLSQLQEGYGTLPKQASAQGSSPTSRPEHAEEALPTRGPPGDPPPTSTTSDKPATNKRRLPLENKPAKKPRNAVKVSELDTFRRGCE
ncbi:hypothetical protein QAD02_003735 [Eretmocerus hayati]|uniref:Uncharacterized protein n=1 Tax=Eretmocerus hayati TaxID=131215 RepID=A0ACC2NPD5_9HYME|nr:hypothetical protein QAD02_003735 [Eretmocerus hayati]